MRRDGLSAAQQAFGLRARFPEATVSLKASCLVWTATLQPTPLSRSYRLQVRYRPRRRPEVRVLDALRTRAGCSLPHTYDDGTLCLYMPGEWDDNMFLVDSIIPWASEWLVHYEIWLADGKWYGGGEWPPRRASEGKSQ